METLPPAMPPSAVSSERSCASSSAWATVTSAVALPAALGEHGEEPLGYRLEREQPAVARNDTDEIARHVRESGPLRHRLHGAGALLAGDQRRAHDMRKLGVFRQQRLQRLQVFRNPVERLLFLASSSRAVA